MTKACELFTWDEFINWYNEITSNDYKYEGNYIEEYVIEDSVGFMTKIKLQYYTFWKFMRTISHSVFKYGKYGKESIIQDPLAIKYYEWIKYLYEKEDIDNIPKDICSLRKMFLKSM